MSGEEDYQEHEEPPCPICPLGAGEERDYDITGRAVYVCRECGTTWTFTDPENRAGVVIRYPE